MLGAELLPPLPPRLCGLKFGQTWISPSLSRGANRSRWYLGSHGSNSWCFTSAKYCKMRRQKNEISVISRHHCLRAMFSPKIAQTQPATEKFQEAVDWCWRRGVEVLWEMWKPRGAASLPACPACQGLAQLAEKKWTRKENSRNGRQKESLCFEEGEEEACTSHFLLCFLQTILPTPNPVGRLLAGGKKRIPFLAQLAWPTT